jgi:hypothetical protein
VIGFGDCKRLYRSQPDEDGLQKLRRIVRTPDERCRSAKLHIETPTPIIDAY